MVTTRGSIPSTYDPRFGKEPKADTSWRKQFKAKKKRTNKIKEQNNAARKK